ncbi:hypothetical protein H8356DRAFT_1622919 [Neocallimastix lanati (nom. inval.)]|nr:hypothetical protein H8356DRAFT_1622919 [Neocallimastix sp. JGI-2020a]
MKYFIFLCVLITLLKWVKATCDLSDYVKHANRTFNPLEGKVITFKISMPDKKYQNLIEIAQISSEELYYKYNMNFTQIPEFSEKVNITTIIDGEEDIYEQVNFKIGGNFAKVQDRVGFNIKLKKNKLFYNRRDLRLRPDALDYTHIRSKISADLLNRWGIPSVQETYTKVYINDHYYGLYFLIDAIKPSWIRQIYGIPEGTNDNADDGDDVKTLYHCQSYNSNMDPVNIQKCFNEKEEYLGYTQPLYRMVDDLMKVTTLEQLKKIFNVDNFTRIIIAEYLFSSFDNYLILGHNFHLYQRDDGIWEIIDHDYDSNFGVNISLVLGGYIPLNFTTNLTYDQYVNLDFDHWYADEKKIPIIDILYYDNKSRFVKILKEMLITGFNPDELFPRIDSLSKFVEPYVREEMDVNDEGIYPGRINRKGTPSNHTMEMFYNNRDYEMINTYPGFKDFIQKKFDAVCRHYGFNKKEILRDALFYRTQIAIKDKMDDINKKIEERRSVINETKEKFQDSFNKILSDLSSLLNKLGK